MVDSVLFAHLHVTEWKRADGGFATRSGGMITLKTPDYDKAVEAAKQKGVAESQKMPENL